MSRRSRVTDAAGTSGRGSRVRRRRPRLVLRDRTLVPARRPAAVQVLEGRMGVEVSRISRRSRTSPSPSARVRRVRAWTPPGRPVRWKPGGACGAGAVQGRKKVHSSCRPAGGTRGSPSSPFATTMRTLSTLCRAIRDSVDATAGTKTSKATMLQSGRRSARATSDSPRPGPISTIRGASRPKVDVQSTDASAAMEVDVSRAGTSTTQRWA